MKKAIHEFSRDNYSHLEKRVVEAHVHLLNRQEHMLSDPNQANAAEEIEATKKWQELAVVEEAFFH